jgi:hypothetical protein
LRIFIIPEYFYLLMRFFLSHVSLCGTLVVAPLAVNVLAQPMHTIDSVSGVSCCKVPP